MAFGTQMIDDHADGSGGTDASQGNDEPTFSDLDQRFVEVLSWLLDTETRARIYVNLRQHPGSTSEEVAEGTGLYPSTVREALADLAEEGVVERRKRQSAGAGNNPYEYTAIAPSDLVREAGDRIQSQLNDLCQLDSLRDEADSEPVRIEVEAGRSSR
jgi:predicted transcriptional regulator